jgi:hypothetical protein
MRTALAIIGLAALMIVPLTSGGEEIAVTDEAVLSRLPAEEMARLVSRGDIRRDSPPTAGQDWIPLYQGNGRMGCCFGPWGLHVSPAESPSYTLRGVTALMHMQHRTRGKFNADYLLPLATVYWEQSPQEVGEYTQHQSFYDGTIRTHYRTNDYAVTIESWVDPVHRNTMGFRIETEGDCPAIVVAPLRTLSIHYDQQLEQTFTAALTGGIWQATVRCLEARSDIQIRSTAPVTQVDEGARIELKPGRTDLLIVVNDDEDVRGEKSLEDTRRWWHSTWEDSGWMDISDDTVQQVWIRSLAYIFSTYNDDGLGDPAPMGFAGNDWPFPFPFDNSCQHPILLAMGRLDIARKWVEYWHSQLDGLRHYTQHVWQRKGIGFPHVYPYGPFEGYHDPRAPNKYYYPLYNSGIMLRMATQTASMVNEEEWKGKHVEPLIAEAALFYLDMAEKKSDGKWHFSTTPSIGLDEHGGVNQPDYVCTLFAAEYAFQQAVAHGLDHEGRYAAILRDGIAYESLLNPERTYYLANAGTGARDSGHQKHPDQLFPLVHFPLGPQVDSPTRFIYTHRYDLTADANRANFAGHTLGEFILASARMHDAAGWRKDWAQIQPGKIADPDWIQFYESSKNHAVFYVTSHGLFAQAILETVVSTWWGELDIAACVPWQGRVRFGNIRTPLGVTVSGSLIDGKGQAQVEAWKDTSFPFQGRTISLRRGERMTLDVQADPRGE